MSSFKIVPSILRTTHNSQTYKNLKLISALYFPGEILKQLKVKMKNNVNYKKLLQSRSPTNITKSPDVPLTDCQLRTANQSELNKEQRTAYFSTS